MNPHQSPYTPAEPDALETLLAALRSTTPPKGLHDRVLHNLQTRAAAQSSAPRRLRPAWLTPTCLYATLSIAAAILFAAVFTSIGRVPQGSRLRPGAQQHLQTQAPAHPPATEYATTPVQPDTLSPSRHPLGLGFSPDNAEPQISRAFAPDLRPAKTTQQAESFPTPPLPLTDQERLLLQIARHRNPANLAALNPVQQQILIAQETAQFKDFFYHPPLPSNLDDPGTTAQPEAQPPTTAPIAERGKE